MAARDAERLGVEIETGQSDVLANVRKCLATGFGRVIVAATNPAAHDRIARWIAAESLADDERLELVLCQHRY